MKNSFSIENVVTSYIGSDFYVSQGWLSCKMHIQKWNFDVIWPSGINRTSIKYHIQYFYTIFRNVLSNGFTSNQLQDFWGHDEIWKILKGYTEMVTNQKIIFTPPQEEWKWFFLFFKISPHSRRYDFPTFHHFDGLSDHIIS